MKKKFFYMKDKIKSKKERKSRKEEKINLNEILKDESYKLGTFRRNGKGFGFVNVGEEEGAIYDFIKEWWQIWRDDYMGA